MTLITLSEAHITKWDSRHPASFVRRPLRQLRGMRLSEPFHQPRFEPLDIKGSSTFLESHIRCCPLSRFLVHVRLCAKVTTFTSQAHPVLLHSCRELLGSSARNTFSLDPFGMQGKSRLHDHYTPLYSDLLTILSKS
jgi:hypothetical protein